MTNRTALYGRFLLTASFLVFPLTGGAIAETPGHDWYCPDPEAHTQFVEHLKLHQDQNTENVAEQLDKIYQDAALDSEQKHVQAMEILNKYTAQLKLGVGD